MSWPCDEVVGGALGARLRVAWGCLSAAWAKGVHTGTEQGWLSDREARFVQAHTVHTRRVRLGCPTLAQGLIRDDPRNLWAGSGRPRAGLRRRVLADLGSGRKKGKSETKMEKSEEGREERREVEREEKEKEKEYLV